jgi:hypothetical protein
MHPTAWKGISANFVCQVLGSSEVHISSILH